jgi:hypothetical protein
MPSYRVEAAQEVRRLPEKENYPPRAVDHLTLSANGTQTLVTMFRKVGDPLPDVGSTIELELGEQDRFDKDRRKATKPRSGGGGGFRKRDPSETHRIEMQSARRDALHYIELKIRLGKVTDFDIGDVGKITDRLHRLLEPPPPPSDVPADTEGLPPADDIEPSDGEGIPF